MTNKHAHSSPNITLREVTGETVRTICNLRVAKDQEKFVAPNAVSIAEAYFTKEAWFRAIYADETPVGFVMLDENPEKGRYFLWRFMIDEKHQRKGYGRKALELVIQHVQTRLNAKELYLTYHEGEGSPYPFYRKRGFENTGNIECGELEMKLVL